MILVHLYGISFQSSQKWIASQSVTADCRTADDRYEGTAEAVYRGNSYHCHELRGTMPDPYAVDINIFEGGLRVYESKYFSADGNDTLADAVQFVVAERAGQMLLQDKSKEEDELIESMISTISSIKCVGKPNRELLRFLQQHNFPRFF